MNEKKTNKLIDKFKLKLANDKRTIIATSLWLLFGFCITLFLILTTSLLRQNWIDGNSFSDPSNSNHTSLTYNNIKPEYGKIRIYSLTMTLGMMLAIGFSLFNFYKKGLSINDLSLSVIFIIPSSLFGASFFGKIDQDISFFERFAFWEGGLAIHGGVFAGSFVGLIFFYIVGRRTKISLLVYGDAIIPNILLGQVVGRWGNFFNHEVLGHPVVKIADSIPSNYNDATIDQLFGAFLQNHSRPLWLPDIILKNSLSVYTGTSTTINGVSLEYGNLVLLSPIFFYESILLLICWIVITFIIPNIYKVFSKPMDANNNVIKIDNLFSFVQFFKPWIKSSDQKISRKDAWKQALENNTKSDAVEEFKLKSEKINSSNKNFIVKKWQTNQVLLDLNNKNNYPITRSGVAMFSYFMLWNVVRYVLELTRSNDNLFISNNKDLSLAIVGLSVVIGFVGIVCSQLVFCRLFRKPGWLYEVDYFKVRKSN
ncbi:diacylglyceryl transferase [Mycoplasma feriruminatoris]|uniref:prolipoprotein diacylglyceryl transferase family protein n=1 Tax=Mycoplasma feriruminatoris TaxID=1179777 RepID=UPI00241F29DF|nr:prolipoprotein diacylglyceryl transferase family protein [Mycoplasma feriruminatoris]WFQ90673.1 diacylglyceryl transferase [Mycoplasma feriruminatoris]